MSDELFSIEDQTEEMTDEEIKKSNKLATEMFKVIEESEASPTQVLQAIAAITSYVLSECSPSRAHANKGLESICMSVAATLTNAERNCQVNWNQRSRH